MDSELKKLCKMDSTSDIIGDMEQIINRSRNIAYLYVNRALVLRNWLIGRRIDQEILKDQSFEDNYGKKLIVDLSRKLTSEYGKGFSPSTLYKYVRFYKLFPKILSTVWTQSFSCLSWSHYRLLIGVVNDDARVWYEREAAEESWAVRTLQRNIESQYYFRMIKTPNPEVVKAEMKTLTANYQRDKASFIKDPVVIEFLGLSPNTEFTETKLESRIISNIQKFILEMGKGYAFMARQQRIHTENDDYFIDLVFYNVILKCYVLVDLKTTKVTHQDVGQMDMYVRMYDELKRTTGDNPTLGIILCSETNEDIARYSVLHDNDHLFAAKYKLYLPNEDDLRKEIDLQKQIQESRESEKDWD